MQHFDFSEELKVEDLSAVRADGAKQEMNHWWGWKQNFTNWNYKTESTKL